MKPIIFYDLKLEGLGDRYWSPNPNKTRFALNIKGLPYETVYLDFFAVHSEIPKITKSDRKPTVPVIVDPNTGAVVQDSWEIALYLDKQYPDAPRSLFHGESNIGVHQLVYESMQMPIISGVFRKCVLDIMRNLSGDLAKWFRQSRENMLGCSLEEFASDADVQLEKSACATLQSVHKVLERNAYVTGSQVGYADALIAAWIYFLYVFHPDTFNAKILGQSQAFDDWWKRMGKFIQDKPPADDE
ncbi:hypothetical protein VTP01DRAFT_9680 [Rhizomucor pusillus]|uniref:uncharacterized protein n=1 Tax=Rhizomucor pusillus TaxID=4840 RepID=UPI003743FA34